MSRLCAALAIALLAGCQPALAQDITLNVRQFDRTVDARNTTTTDKLTWYAGESIEYIVRLRRGREVADVPPGSVPVWAVMQGTNTYIFDEGEVLTNGTVRFWVPAHLSALPAGTYTSWASAYEGTNRVGVLDRTQVDVRWRPGRDYTATEPMDNVLDQVLSWWAAANSNLAAAVAPLASTDHVALAIAAIPAPDLTPYATTSAVATAVAPLASTDHVALAIAAIPAPDLTPYATTGAVATAVAPLASTTHVAQAIAAIPAPDLTPYATTSAVAAAVAPLASTTHVAQAIAAIPAPDLTPYATTGAVAAAVAPLASTQALAAAVAPLASTDHVAQAIAAIPAPDLTPYATTSAVAAAVAPLASTTHVAQAIAAIPAPDLTPYATTSAVAAAVAPLASTTHVALAIAAIPAPDLTPYATTQALAGAVAPLASAQALADAVAPLASTDYVGGAISALPPIPGAGDYVPPTRIITINGVAYDLSADRSWTIDSGGAAVYGNVFATDLISPSPAYTNVSGLPTTITTNRLHISGLTDGSMRMAIVTTNSAGKSDIMLDITDGTTKLGSITPSCDGTAQTVGWPFTNATNLYISRSDIPYIPASNAAPPTISTIQVYAPADPSLIGKESDFAGQILLVDDPSAPRQVANFRHVATSSAAALASALAEVWSRSRETIINEFGLIFGPRWEIREVGEELHLYYGGILQHTWIGGGTIIPKITGITITGTTVTLAANARTNGTYEVDYSAAAVDWTRIGAASITQTVIGEKSIQLAFANPVAATSLLFRVASVTPATTRPRSKSIADQTDADGNALATESWVVSYVATNTTAGGGAPPSTNAFAGLPSVLVDTDWTWTNHIYAVGADTSTTNISITLPNAGSNFTSVVIRKFSNLHALHIMRGTNTVYTLYDDGAARAYDWWPGSTNWYWRN